MARVINFEAEWDPEAQVWWTSASSEEGIVTEAETVEKLRERLRLIVPDFLEATDQDSEEIEINLTVRMTDIVRAA
jgi:predicted RNase H-like HicB family nuclease